MNFCMGFYRVNQKNGPKQEESKRGFRSEGSRSGSQALWSPCQHDNVKKLVNTLIFCRSCCVDEIAAEHYCADAVVHFGHACLSPTPGKVAVCYKFGKQPVNIDMCIAEVLSLFAGDLTCPVLLLYDTVYHYAVCSK